ncbi:hypothetical protein QL285_012743 [Trifolium repens]|nr:hypothetical protein QL285_012743 [Trifolium repens]
MLEIKVSLSSYIGGFFFPQSHDYLCLVRSKLTITDRSGKNYPSIPLKFKICRNIRIHLDIIPSFSNHIFLKNWILFLSIHWF